MKVYIFTKDNEIYAYSNIKELAELFQIQRNMNVFKVEKVYMDKYDFMAFSYKKRDQKIIKDYLSDSINTVEFASTVRESSYLDDSCDQIVRTIDSIHNSLVHIPFKKEYLNSIIVITKSITMYDKNCVPTLNIDTLKLFYYLFKDTFIDISNKT